MKKFVSTTLATGLAMFLLGGAWHMGIMGDFYREHSSNPNEPILGFIILGYLVLAAIMTYVYPLGENKKEVAWMDGLRFGVIVGLIWVTPHAIILIGAEAVAPISVVVDGLWHLVEQGIGGIVLATVFRKVT